LNAEQLNSARLARWSQNGDARLTLESAADWLNTIGFCPYLPAGPTGSAPSPSFLEAVVGRPAQTPSTGERSRAAELLVRMVENSAAVPLKLGKSLGEHPDFVTSPEVLRYVYALLGDRTFKTGPSTVGNSKVTPLALHCWNAIQDQGPLDVFILQPILGRDITETAIARALQELWVGLYIFPVLSLTGKPAKWELLSRRFPAQVASGASTGQAESQSAMVSLYLHAIVAAAEEEVLAFLSPLAPQSKLREVIRGLGSMRQLDMIDIGGRSHLCLQGGLLPEMVAQLSEEQLGLANGKSDVEETVPDTAGVFPGGIEIEREPQRAHGEPGEVRKFVPKKFIPKKFVPRDSAAGESTRRPCTARPSGGRLTGSRTEGTAPSRPRSFAASAGGASSSAGRSFKKPGADRAASTRGLGERAKRWEKSGDGVGGRAGGDRPFERKPFKASGFKPGGFKSAGAGSPKPWASKSPRSSAEGAKPWAKRPDFGTGASAAPRGSDAEERPKRWQKPSEGAGAAVRYKKPYAAKSFGAKSSGFRPAGSKPGGFKSGGTKPWTRKTGASGEASSAAKPWVRRDAETTGGGEERPKRWEKSGPGAARPSSGGRPGYGARPAEKKPWGEKPGGAGPGGRKHSGFTASGFKSAGTKSAEGRAEGVKPWVSKGAESRVGSAKSYAARTSRAGEGAAPRGPRKPFGKSDGAKPWAKRASATGDAGDRPKRREKPDSAGAGGGEKREVKPFWAKNPRGGKGSVAASRTNRPRGGKKAGGKKGGKKK
jgi:23S rRNA pseudouridine2605 synthase